MTRFATTFTILVLALACSAFGQTWVNDPNIMVGATFGACPAGCSGDPTAITSTGFDLFSNGSPTASVPWYILLAIPSLGTTPTAPTITGTGFTISAAADAGQFLPTTSGNIYDFADTNLSLGLGGAGSASMNATNMFGTAEQAAFGSTPSFFEIFVYTVNPGTLTGGVNFFFNVSPSMPAGTFVAGLGANGNQPFSTPFTTTGLVNGPPGPPNVPEPASILLLGTVSLMITGVYRKRRAVRS